uniref:uncharacterized protein KIAA0355 isoform X2 n=1 Tax=Ciona intestinalis TaxID=7719 RepID=UPI000EF53225|nr:uncharacterized protein KIAA0355 isoform X2 [Ciona intestinalis]|eukprot:XP_026689926.1 uncharacterized protein KIAA0355 isoform X2 [Ciona intestinalis]
MLDIGSVLGCGNANQCLRYLVKFPLPRPYTVDEPSPRIESEAPGYIEACTQVSPIKVVHAKHEHVCHFERKISDANISNQPSNEYNTRNMNNIQSILDLEWENLRNTTCVKSWDLSKKMTTSLRESTGLTESEIHHLLNTSSVSDSYVRKLNQRISSSLKNYEGNVRSLALPIITIQGAFHIAPNKAKSVLHGCCNVREMEQGVQHLPVSQFLDCELPLINFKIGEKVLVAGSSGSLENANCKIKTVSNLIKKMNPALSSVDVRNLSHEVLGELCPARWRNHVKTSLQLMFGNSGLVVLDTVQSEVKLSSFITSKSTYLIAVVPSTWCVKEDPGTMFLLHRKVDPDKTIVNIGVRYLAVFDTRKTCDNYLQPGVLVEVSLNNACGKLHNNTSTFWLDGNLNEGNLHTNEDSNLNDQSSGTTQDAASDSEEAVQDAIKLLSGSLKIRNEEKMEVADEEKDKDNSEEQVINKQKSSSTLPLGEGNKQNKVDSNPKANTIPTTRSSSVNQGHFYKKQSSHKSASFTAFDRSLHNYNSASTSPKMLALSTNQNISEPYVTQSIPGPYMQHNGQPHQNFNSVSMPVLFRSPVPVLVNSQLTRPVSPLCYFPPHQASVVSPQGDNFIPRQLFKSASSVDFGTIHSQQSHHVQQEKLHHIQQMFENNLPNQAMFNASSESFRSNQPNISPSILQSKTHLPSYKAEHSINNRSETKTLHVHNNEVSVARHESLGPIGSPASSRRGKPEKSQSNTWPYKGNVSNIMSNANCSSEYANYLAQVQSLNQHERIENSQANANRELANTGMNSFDIFSTPDLVQHVIPRKSASLQENSDSAVKHFTSTDDPTIKTWEMWPSVSVESRGMWN